MTSLQHLKDDRTVSAVGAGWRERTVSKLRCSACRRFADKCGLLVHARETTCYLSRMRVLMWVAGGPGRLQRSLSWEPSSSSEAASLSTVRCASARKPMFVSCEACVLGPSGFRGQPAVESLCVCVYVFVCVCLPWNQAPLRPQSAPPASPRPPAPNPPPPRHARTMSSRDQLT